MALIGPMKYLTIGNKTYEIESGDSDIYWLEYGSTVNWSEVEAAYNANKQIICYELQDNTYSYYYLVTLGFTENNGDLTASLSFMEVNSLYQNMAYWMYSYDQGSWYKETYSLSTMKTYFLTCFTDASTQIKTVSSSGFSLSNGTIVGILFTTGNTADAPQLNINSTGAKPIYVGGSVTNGTTNVLKWSANTLLYFVYYAANYYYISSVSAGTVEPSRGANTWYGTSTTAAATQAKTSTINNFVLVKGALASIRFTYANTYTSAKITLNINSTGAKDVYYNGTVTSSTNTLLWNAGEVLTFMYDGTGYQYIGKSVQKVSQLTNDSGYLTGITSTQVTNALGYTPYNGTTNPNGYITSAKDAYYVAINDTVNWSEVYDAYNNDKLIVGYLMVDGHKIYYYLNAIYFDNVSSPSIQDNMTFSQSYAGLSTNIVGADSWDWDGQNGWQNTYVESITDPSTKSSGQYLQYNGSSWVAANVTAGVSDVQINGTSILSSGTANIVTNTAYNSSSNKIATMSDITNAVPNNSNWVNGSATGSIRTVGSLPESNIYTIGENAVAEGYSTKASGDASHAEGGSTTASEESAHAEGYVTTASGYASHAEGYVTTASSSYAHAEGNGTFASGVGSHAEGDNTIASGSYAHAEGGGNTTASGSYAHAEGLGTLAQRKSQHVFGEYNVADTGGDGQTARGTYVEIVGKGTSTSARSNARTLDWDGNETLAGKLTLGATPTANMDAATKQYVDNAMTVVTLNGTTTSNASFYAPTTAGTSDYFLKSSGSGAPSWSQPIKYGTSLPASGDFTGQVFILIE